LQHKIKPSKIFLAEYSKKEKFALLDAYKLPHNKYRYAVTQISFDFGVWETEGIIHLAPTELVIVFDGQSKARLVALAEMA
jgi:hypothetical protein